MSNTFTIVSIEGNIGSGKSTLLENLHKHYNNNTDVVFLKEPVDEWAKITDENGVTMIEKFYADQYKYSFSFQMMAYVSRLKIMRETLKNINAVSVSKHIIIITERSLHTDKNVFAKMLYDSNKIEHINYQIYLQWFDAFSEEFNVNKVVYVKTSPENCHSRITKRSREGEGNIPLEYLQSCHKYHNDMLDTTYTDCICKDQLLLNGDVDIYKNADKLEEWICAIDDFITPIIV